MKPQEAVSRQLRIGELALRAGTGKPTIKHYLNLGLVAPTRVESQGYRLFDADSVRRIRIIKTARTSGFGLWEIRAMLDTIALDEIETLLTSLPPLRCRAELRTRGVDLAPENAS